MKKVLIIIVLLLSLCACDNSTEKFEVKKISCSEKEEILKNSKTMLIDVRTDEEYKEKHLDKAVNIPFDKIVNTLKTYGTIDFKVPIIVYCKSGGRSAQAAASLIEAGYQKVYDLGAMSSCD